MTVGLSVCECSSFCSSALICLMLSSVRSVSSKRDSSWEMMSSVSCKMFFSASGSISYKGQ